MPSVVRILSVTICVALVATPAMANPLVLWYFRDSPVDAPNGVWDDEWSGGTVAPTGELMSFWGPPYPSDCGQYEEANKFVPLGPAHDVLYAYVDPPMNEHAPAGEATVSLWFRQTCWELSTVVVSLDRVAVDGGSPEELLSTSVEVAASAWPPSWYLIQLGETPEMQLADERLRVTIWSPDAQCTDLVWDCHYWDSWLLLPQDDPFDPVEDVDWGSIKALYR